MAQKHIKKKMNSKKLTNELHSNIWNNFKSQNDYVWWHTLEKINLKRFIDVKEFTITSLHFYEED